MDAPDRPGLEMSTRGAAASGTPFVSFHAPDDIVAMALAAGFATAEHLASGSLAGRYLGGRPDGLRPSTGEDCILATT